MVPHRPESTRSLPLFGRETVFVPTGQESARFDARAIETLDVPGPVLMENAGRSAAQILNRLVPRGPVTVVVGPGNNGGDGVVLARCFASWGRRVHLVTVGDRPRPDPLLHGWPLPVHDASSDADELDRRLADSRVVVDALLGTGATGPPRTPQARAIQAINERGTPVFAIDIPSGVDSNTGEVPGEVIRAQWTVAFGAPKLGSLLLPGREYTGRILAVAIGFPPWTSSDASARLITPGWATAHRPRRSLRTHKNAAGRLLLLVGSVGMGGAAVLSARGALEAGAGFVSIATPGTLRDLMQHRVPEAVHVDADDPGALEDALERADAVAAGPGLGVDEGARSRLATVLEHRKERPMVLDADGLNLLARGDLDEWNASETEPVVLTPHPGEAARLMKGSVKDATADPLGSARALARRYSASVLLKGTPSVVAPAGRDAGVLISTSGSSDLARAGMGDVLTGAVGAFLARGAVPWVAAGLALHFTGRSAMLRDEGEALLPTGVARGLGAALAEGGDGETDLELPFLLLDLPAAW